jgi:MYXO-CTERM domain-containing protein
MTPARGAQSLYTIDLRTGRAILVGAIGSRAVLRGFAIATGGAFQVGAPTYTVSESAGSITISITRTGGTSGPASIMFATSARTATSDLDYTESTGTLTFGHMEASRTIDVSILPDMVFEGDETLVLRLSMPSTGARVGMTATATITITDDDVAMVDAGVVDTGAPDAGAAPDAAPASPDAAPPSPDAGVAQADAAAVADAGVLEGVEGGCGCTTGAPADAGFIALFALGAAWALRRRR